jgi:hypothetical protein
VKEKKRLSFYAGPKDAAKIAEVVPAMQLDGRTASVSH